LNKRGKREVSFPVKFETYEIFRIILPGFYFLGLLLLTLFLFAPTRQILMAFSENSIFLFAVVFGGVFLGLGLYAFDHPKRISAYKDLKMPSVYLKEKLCDKCTTVCENTIDSIGKAVDSYFYVFYEVFSAGAQERIFYIGSVYHVFADIRMLSFVFGSIISILSYEGLCFRILSLSDSLIGLLAGFLLILSWLSLHPEFFNKERRSKGDKYEDYITKMQRRFIDIEIDRIREKICRHNQASLKDGSEQETIRKQKAG
jgi:hypothetical protein